MKLNDALDALDGAGVATVPTASGSAEVEVVDVDRLGVRVRRVRVERERRGIAAEAAALPERLRALPERVVPVEVDPVLGGAILRTEPKAVRGGYFEVAVGERSTEVRRVAVSDGERRATDFVLTREQLEHLIEQL